MEKKRIVMEVDPDDGMTYTVKGTFVGTMPREQVPDAIALYENQPTSVLSPQQLIELKDSGYTAEDLASLRKKGLL